MRNTAIFLIVLLTFSLISPYITFAETDLAEKQDLIEAGEDHADEDQTDVVVEENEEDLRGHIRGEDAEIYRDIHDLSESEAAGSTYIDQVYYMKKQAIIDNELYYLITSDPEDGDAEIGWVVSGDLITAPFLPIDEYEETLFIDGSGIAYEHAWGGKEDIIYSDLTPYADEEFTAEFAGEIEDDIWYRGILDDKTVWIQADYLKEDPADTDASESETSDEDEQLAEDTEEAEKSDDLKEEPEREDAAEEESRTDSQPSNQQDEAGASDEKHGQALQFSLAAAAQSTAVVQSKTSRLGHIRSGKAQIYKTIGDTSTAIKAGAKYTNKVYYIKKQAKVDNQTYYLISTSPSSTKGVIGWLKSGDLSTHSHKSVDKESKTFYIKGTGKAYDTAWGGNKNEVYNLALQKGKEFKVHLTEKVGSNTWYRGTLNGKTVWIHSSYLDLTKESTTSRLGHIRSGKAQIYKTIGDTSTAIKAGDKYTNKVYYIKKQAKVDNQTYYLISTSPSSTKGVIGWLKSGDLSTHPHKSADKESKTFYIKGTGKAYDTAWGGSKNQVYNLAQQKGKEFKVHLTEKVGSNTWYRGELAGKTVWMHESYVTSKVENKTSKLGHIRSSKVQIYKTIGNDSTAITAGAKYTNKVYYIKKQAKVNNQTYYLISTSPSSTKDVIGWVKSGDLSTHPHKSVDKKNKKFFVKGTGNAYDTAWGGSKNHVYKLSQHKGETFSVHLTERVGENTWYRGVLNGKTVWIHASYLVPPKQTDETTTNYSLTLQRMVDIQMAVNPQTDKKYKLWIREDAFNGKISNGKGTVQGSSWNLRRGPGTEFLSGGTVTNGTVLPLKSSSRGSDGYTWYHVKETTGWVTADRADVAYYLNPSKFLNDLKGSLQFLKLSQHADIDVKEVNTKILNGKGILAGKAQAFADAARINGINEIYLISHALLETGNGKSKLATGVKVKGKTVYNMYGIGAKDSCPLECGSQYAYDAGWFTPEAAIKGGAEFVGNSYLSAGQDTLYKMRWNPAAAAKNGFASHQYATDIGWASKQTARMYQLYSSLDGYNLTLDIPGYK